MNEQQTDQTVHTAYKLTGFFAALGFVSYFWAAGFRSAAAFALGALCSCGNLWLFDWISRAIAPGAASRKPWQAGAYVTRYILLLGIGYAIIRVLGVSPLATILGLFSSAAAVLATLIFELISELFRSRISHE